MRKLLSLLVVAVLFVACSKDEDGKSSSYSFKDQDVQGKIGNVDFMFKSGDASLRDTEYSIDLYPLETEEPCGWVDSEYDIFFDVPNEVGVYKLKLDWSDPETSFTVTLVDWSSDIPMNYIASEGAVEIVSIDTEAGTITGKLDIRAGDDTYVNGNFTVPICE